MYFSAIGFINDVKKGPFWEHSPILYDVSGIKDGWGKINKGMIKMFNAEVLSKFPVVQHFPFGSLFRWETDPEAATPTQSVHMQNQPMASAAVTGGVGIPTERPSGPPAGPGGVTAGTAAPWARTQAPPGAVGGSGTAAPWARGPSGPGGVTGTAAPWAQAPTQAPAGAGMAPPMTAAPWARSAGAGAGAGVGQSAANRFTPFKPSGGPGGAPNTGPPPPESFPDGTPGTASNQFAVTKAPWAK